MGNPEATRYFSGPASILSLILLASGIYLIPAVRFPLTRAEAVYVVIFQEMLASGQWLIPTLNGVPYLDNPP